MIVEIRKTAQGTEYWDTEEKKTLFVAAGKKPNFEVTENPKSMLKEDEPSDDRITELNKMTIPELKDYAAGKNIDIPTDIKKKEDIVKHLYDNWVPDSE